MSVPKDRRYNVWAGNPKGVAEDTARCIEEVWERGRGARHYQCGAKRGHGPNGEFCAQHNPEKVKAKAQKREDASKARQAAEQAIHDEAAVLSKRLGVKGEPVYLWHVPFSAVKYGRCLVISFEDAKKLAARLPEPTTPAERGDGA